MSGSRLNALIAGLMAIVNSVFPFLILIGVLHWTADEIAACVLVISNVLTFVGLLFAQSDATNV